MNYAEIYTHDFFYEADGMADWKARRLKIGDALAAIAYAFGIQGLEELRAIIPFEGIGRAILNEVEHTLVDSGGMMAVEQLERVWNVQTRIPRGFLEIGAGRGEVAVSLAQMTFTVQAIEPSPGAVDWFVETTEQFFRMPIGTNLKLINKPAHEAINDVDWSSVDTVLMVESLEHILANDFQAVYERIVEHLRSVSGRFIITNWVDYHPINVGDYASPEVHCRLVDDALYDAWAKDAKNVVYRNGSHLVLDY